MTATLSLDERWGREWASDPENADALARLVRMVDRLLIEARAGDDDLPLIIQDELDLMNKDAKGAGTLLAAVLADPEGDGIDREGALEFWEAAGGDGDDGLGTVMYGDACDDPDSGDYGNGPLVGFVVGAMAVAREQGMEPANSDE